MNILEELTGLKNAGAESVPAPKPTAAAPASSEADLEKYRVTEPTPVAGASVAKPITASANNAALTGVLDIVSKVKPETVLSLPDGSVEAFTRAGVFLGVLKSDGLFVRHTSEHETDPLANLSAADTRPRDEAEEARTDLSPRTPGRVVFLWENYEKHDPAGPDDLANNARLQKRLANDLARAHAQHAADAKPYDPETGRGARGVQTIKNWVA